MPAAEWIALSMQLCIGIKQPNNLELAAFTIASTFNVVISPCHKAIFPLTSSMSLKDFNFLMFHWSNIRPEYLKIRQIPHLAF